MTEPSLLLIWEVGIVSNKDLFQEIIYALDKLPSLLAGIFVPAVSIIELQWEQMSLIPIAP